MDLYCLVLTGRLLDGQDPAAVHERMAGAFGMEGADFRQRVFERAPLLIRRGLEQAAAQAQAAQLEEMGVEAHVAPDDAPLVWLLRQGQLRGPLPQSVLSRYAEAGDQWCHDGGQQWFPWAPASTAHKASLPPPLPATHATATPPPMPNQPSTAVSRWAIAAVCVSVLALLWPALASIALLLGLGTLLWLLRHPGTRGRGWAVTSLLIGVVGLTLWLHRPLQPPPAALVQQPYIPRPLQPLEAADDEDNTTVRPDTTHCAAAPGPRNDEDRFLLTGGQRLLTGRAQRKGDTYVAEAASGYDSACHPDNLQLYVFRSGVFIGTALENAASQATERLTDFELSDDQHLRVSLAACREKAGDCGAPSTRQIEVLHEAGGWIVRRVALASP
ncbi:hypothetical protein [Dyella subtropica]|uniref:hypothetical protein n=1 Tax=Dyella subtropica TaxID=2992127 RepID=UPI002255D533|nr:hypothetical protein [Dyella subtropica]